MASSGQSKLKHLSNTTTKDSIVNIQTTGNFDLQSGAFIEVDGLGYAAGSGPGGGFRYSGGGHGGDGGGMKFIQLTRGKKAVVDDEDFEWLNQYRWTHVPRTNKLNEKEGYARSYFNSREYIYMYRLILGLEESTTQVDHINGDGIDNRKQNLRTAKVYDRAALKFFREFAATNKTLGLF